MPSSVNKGLEERGLQLPGLTIKCFLGRGSGTDAGLPSLAEGRQPADVLPEVRGLALGLCQHEDLLLRERGRQGGMLLTHQKVVVWPGDSCGEEEMGKHVS